MHSNEGTLLRACHLWTYFSNQLRTCWAAQDMFPRVLIQQTEKFCAAVEEIRSTFRNDDPGDCSPERYTDLVFCPVKLNDAALHSAVQQYLDSSAVRHSVLVDWSLMCFFSLFSDGERVRHLGTSLKAVFPQASFSFMRLQCIIDMHTLELSNMLVSSVAKFHSEYSETHP